jgi:hypothetical protein
MPTELKDKKVAELKAMAKKLNIPLTTKGKAKTKAQLIRAINSKKK